MSGLSFKRLLLPLMTAAVAGIAAGPASAGVKIKSAGGLKYVSLRTKTQQLGPTPELKVRCPGDRFVLGGGFLNTGPFDTEFVHAMTPGQPRDRWYLRFNNQSAPFPPIYGTAICDERRPVYKSEAFKVETLEAGSDTAICPDGLHVYSGGAYDPFGRTDRAPFLTSSYPVDLFDGDSVPDDGWRTVVYNADFEDEAKLKATAVCGKRMPAYVATPGFVAAGTQGGVPSFCPSEKRFVYGGGMNYSVVDGDGVTDTSSFAIEGGEPDVHQWAVKVDNHADSGSLTIVTYAVCGKALK